MRSYYRYLRCVKTSVRGRHDGSDRWKVGFYHLLPGYGKILPLARATLCHCQARNDTSGERILQDCHFDSTTPLAQ